MLYEVNVRDVPAQPILGIRAVVAPLELAGFFEDACRDMYAYLDRIGVSPAGPPMSLWHSSPDESREGVDIQTCVPIERPAQSSGRMMAGELPAGRLAYTIHSGPYDGMWAAFDAVWAWIGRNGCEPAGPPRDIILVGAHDVVDPYQYRTEVAWPVRC